MKAGLKLHTEADKRAVQQGVHLLQDPEGKGLGERVFLLGTASVLGYLELMRTQMGQDVCYIYDCLYSCHGKGACCSEGETSSKVPSQSC